MEGEIVGKWILKHGEVLADSNCQIIDSMIEHDLQEIGSSDDGWSKRYRHRDGTVWELTYPESHLHGGGPPKLTRVKK